MTDTTSILDLPTDPAGGGSIGGNVSFSANENQGIGSGSGVTLDQSTINQIVSGLQQASTSGATQLQSRDIPRNTENIMHDPQIQPNFIPHANNQDYIQENEDNDDIIQNYNSNAKYGDSLDSLYEEIQIPLLISILYFLFQLPIFKRYLYRFFPVLFLKDGNINIYGYLFTSTFFGILYYFISKITSHYSRF